jgi:hypothetical protein
MRFQVAVTTLALLAGLNDIVFGQDQRSIAAQVLSANADERNRGLEAAKAIRPENVGPELRNGLITLLERQNAMVEKARMMGVTIDTFENPEFITGVHHVVAGLNHPDTIPALVQALGMGTAIRTLVKFGEQAAPAVLAVATSPKNTYETVDEALRILRLMVETRNERPLSPGTLEQIRRIARQRLTGEQYFTTLWYAMDLAVLFDDAQLRAIVQDIAAHPSEIVARGITEPDIIEKTQKRAADRLAGAPALPRPESFLAPAVE